MKRIVLAFDGTITRIDPQFCDHKHAIMTYNEADGTLYHCPDCDSLLDEDYAIIPTPPLEEIF